MYCRRLAEQERHQGPILLEPGLELDRRDMRPEKPGSTNHLYNSALVRVPTPRDWP
jgi:hypothetical protein